MWVVEGAFDGEPGNLERKKTKLLKPNRTYTLGRKAKHPLQLVISHPKVSAEQVTFVVKEHPVGKVDDPSYRPTLILQNCKNKALQISRTVSGHTERVLLQGLAEEPVQDGDVIAIVTGIYVSVHWKSIVCYTVPRAPIVPLARCSALGLKVVSTLRPEVTHHLTPTLSATAPLAISMLSQAHFVQPDWLTELLHLGETASSPEAPSVLEQDFRLPPEADYRPPFDQELPPLMKSYIRWEPSRKRIGFLKGWRFLFIGEKSRELDSEMRTTIERGDGQYETFDAASGAIRWKQCLTRNQRKADDGNSIHLCIIGNREALNAVSPDSWAELEDILEVHKFRLFSRAELLEAIFLNELSRINSSPANNDGASGSYEDQEDSPLPSVVPNTHEIQPTSSASLRDSVDTSEQASTSRSRLRKRVTPAVEEDIPVAEEHQITPSAPNPPPSESPIPDSENQLSRNSQEPEAQAPRKKPLIRRARTAAPTSASKYQALEESTQDVPSTTKPPSSGKPPSQSSVTAGRSVLLRKRAHDGTSRHPIVANLEEEKETDDGAEPMLKKYRKLFEETDPERIGSQHPEFGFSSGGIADSQIFSNVPSETSGAAAINGLSIVQEEDEERNSPTDNVVPNVYMREPNHDSPLSPRKRPPTLETTEQTTESQHPPTNGTQLSTTSKIASSKAGAAPGNPDTDAAFLRAIASTKKGKRGEDEFDREFNNLRISVPERDKEEREDEWKVLADFGDERNILGNYMVIMEMDVPEHRKGQSSRAQSRETETPAWRGKPDFKKFKKKTNIRTRPSVELVVDDENDYGMGAGYWKTGSQSQSQSQPQPGLSQANGATNSETQQRDQAYLQPSQTQNRGFLQPIASPSKGKKSQTQTHITGAFGSRQQRTQTKASRGKTPDVQPPTLRARGQGKGKSKQVLSDVDESEDADDIVNVGSGLAKNETGDNPLFLDDGVGESIDLDLDGFSVDETSDNGIGVSEPPTLRSQSQRPAQRSKKPDSDATTTKRTATTSRSTNPRKRGADLMDDDSDTGVAFTGFGGKKKTRSRY